MTGKREKLHLFLSQQRIILYFMAVLTGAVSGLCATLFRQTIYGITYVFSFVPNTIGVVGWIIIPVIGGVASVLLTDTLAPEAGGEGIPAVMESYVLQGGRMRPRVIVVKTLSSALTIGSGGSAGREGPIGQIGAGAGAYVAQLFRLNTSQTRTLVVCGLSSGIAAAFEAPLGGAIFGVELLVGELSSVSVVPVILASVVAVAVAVGLFGGDVSSFVSPAFVLSNYEELLFYLILGLLFGPLSKLWVHTLYLFEEFFEGIKTSKYVRCAIGAVLVGMIAVVVLSLEPIFGYHGLFLSGAPYVPATMGSGYEFINSALTLDPLYTAPFLALVTFGLLKSVATSLTLGSGGSGGVFAPTLFIGAGLGGGFGYLFHWFAPNMVPYPMAFALVGMGAMFAGAAHVPVTCIVMTMEITGSYEMILPLMVAVSSSYILSTAISRESIYTRRLSRRGIAIRQGVYVDALKSVTVAQVMTRDPAVLYSDMTASEALHMLSTTHHTKFPVLDREGHIVGTVIAEDLERRYDPSGREYTVGDLMFKDFLTVTLDKTMDEVLHAMMLRREGHAVILDPNDPTRMIGFLTKTDVFRAYEAAVARLRLTETYEDYSHVT